MRNLFIMHTQYNLILATSILIKENKEGTNDLVLHAEFKISNNYMAALKEIYDNIWIIQDKFNGDKHLPKLLKFIKKYRKAKAIFKYKYDNVFTSQEEYFDTLLLTKLSKCNSFRYHSVEEDAYFSFNRERNLDQIPFSNYYNSKRLFNKIFNFTLKEIFGTNIYFRPVHCYGMNPSITDAHVIFPQCVRREIQGKRLHEVDNNMIIQGVHNLYKNVNCDIQTTENGVLFFFDLLSRYKDIESIQKIVKQIVKICEENKLLFYYKYHPRETSTISFIEDIGCCKQFPAIIPSEKILIDLYGKDLIVLGNATTAIQVAAKLNFKTYSIASIDRMNNEYAIEAFKRMGIIVPDFLEQLINEINLKIKEE